VSKPDAKTPKRRRIPWLLGTTVLISFVVLILLQTSNLWKDFTVETAGDTLLLYALSSLNFFAFVIFGFIFLRSILKLIRERRALQLGSRIKTRLLLYFAAVSLLPIVAMAGFSTLFMNRAVERWFTQMPENVVRRSKAVQNQAVADQSDRLTEAAALIAQLLDDRNIDSAELDRLADAGNLTYIEIISAEGETLAKAEMQIDESTRADLQTVIVAGRTHRPGIPPVNDGLGYDVATAELSEGRRLLIVPGMRSGESVSEMFDRTLIEFDRMKEQQGTVMQLGFLTLGVLTFLLIFASSWTALYIARGLTDPIKALAEGADEIARGNLSHRVDVIAEDELALLVTAFNQMSGRLEENSAEIRERRRYIETVLESLPTGVISFDADDRVSTINPAAVRMLKLEDGHFAGFELDKLVGDENRLIIERLVSRAKRIGHAAEQTVLRTESIDGTGDASSEITVAMTATALENGRGAVLVIEDLSELIAAQRASAWQEVARRMAHEIKNPLTPIQLSAERIAKRFGEAAGNGNAAEDLHTTDGQTVNVIRQGTDTILREVQSLKSMVDEFSRFARLPEARPEPEDLSGIVRQVLPLYVDRLDGVRIEADLAEGLPPIMLDAEQMKRVFVNLFDNAIEAFDDDAADRGIRVTTRHDAARDLIVAEVSDNGKGITPADLQRLFQPYFSTKGRGTGLGLAIVHRIVSEHKGKIKVVGNQPRGAKFMIELPVAAAQE
jgi:nitrogen fixation/metabolism regulation signal transduction histidine kinase